MPAAATQLISAAVRRIVGSRPPRTIPLSDKEMYVLVPRPDRVAVDLAGSNRFLEDDATRAYRSGIALELMDEDVYGFLVLLLRRGDPRPEISFRSQTEPGWREAFAAAIGQVALALVD